MEEEIRFIQKYINLPIFQYELIKNSEMWSQICSSLDVIEDTALAIEAYNSFSPANEGEKYLAIYGLLQSLVLQQDAVENLCEGLGLGIKLNKYPRILEIREIRNDCVGHPTKRDKKKSLPASHHYISRITIDKTGFTLMSDYTGSSSIFREIEVDPIIKDQKRILTETIIDVTNNLKSKAQAHKEKYSMDKLQTLFSESLYTHFQKLSEDIRQKNNPAAAQRGLRCIRKVHNQFRDKIIERAGSMDAFMGAKETYNLIDYPLSELERFYKNHDGCIDEKTAYIFSCFVEGQMNELAEQAKDIDHMYDSPL